MSKESRWQVVAVLGVGLFMAILDSTIVSVTLPQMQKAFGTDFETITWVATAYFLAQAAIIPIMGYLSDRLGSKLVFLTALTMFTVGSALCSLAPTKEALIAFRVFQGIGGGALLPVVFAIIYRLYLPTERGPVAVVLGIPAMMAPTFGPTIGGFLSTNFNWRAIFVVNLPIGVIVLILAILILPKHEAGEQTKENKKPFDVLGLVLSMLGFTALVYGITEAGSKGWGDPTVLTFIIVGAIVLAAFTLVELLVSDSVIDIRLLVNYTFSIANALLWVVVAVIYASLFLLSLFFENIQGNSSLTAGEFLIGQGLAMGAGIALSGALYNRVGPRIFTVLGLILMAAGAYGLTQIDLNTTGQSLQIWLIVRGFGMGLVNPPLQTLALSVVSNRGMAKASSLISITRQVAGAFGVAGLTTYLTQQATTHAQDIGKALQTGIATHHLSGVAATCARAAGPKLDQAAVHACVGLHASVMGMADTFWIVLICCAASIIPALLMGRDPAIEAHKQAKARREDVELEKAPTLSE